MSTGVDHACFGVAMAGSAGPTPVCWPLPWYTGQSPPAVAEAPALDFAATEAWLDEPALTAGLAEALAAGWLRAADALGGAALVGALDTGAPAPPPQALSSRMVPASGRPGAAPRGTLTVPSPNATRRGRSAPAVGEGLWGAAVPLATSLQLLTTRRMAPSLLVLTSSQKETGYP